MSIPYWLDGGADVAETTYTAFAGTRHETTARLLVRRVRPTPVSQLALDVVFSCHANLTDRDGDLLDVEADHRRHAVVEHVIADLKGHAGLAHLPSGRFAANAAWLALVGVAHAGVASMMARDRLGRPVVPRLVVRGVGRPRACGRAPPPPTIERLRHPAAADVELDAEHRLPLLLRRGDAGGLPRTPRARLFPEWVEGSPPRVRRAEEPLDPDGHLMGVTSARAESRPCSRRCAAPPWVTSARAESRTADATATRNRRGHLRACGEQVVTLLMVGLMLGSPPRVRRAGYLTWGTT